MTIKTETSIKYEYKCVDCGNDYIEQRRPEEGQFFDKCQRCGGVLNIINTTESTYEVYVPESTVEEETNND